MHSIPTIGRMQSRENKYDIERFGDFAIRYALVLVIFWIGCLKFTAYESQGVFTHASNSPLLAWGYHFLNIQNFSRALGAVELTIALLLAIKPISPRLSVLGSLGAIAMFLTTLSFLMTTPGVWQKGYGFPALSPAPGQFLLKDAVLLGVAIWTAGDALRSARLRVADGIENRDETKRAA